MGVQILKCPFDVWMYQEIIYETRPDLIIETGTFNGGSAFFLAHMLDLIQTGNIITIDVNDVPGRPTHPRITYVSGSSTDERIIRKVKRKAAEAQRVMVILDSDHSESHVSTELDLYADLVSPGCYLIIEDTNINGHPIGKTFGPGPMEAARTFLASRHDFKVDRDRERLHLTFNPQGYLRRMPNESTDSNRDVDGRQRTFRID